MSDIVKSIIDAMNYQFAVRHFSRPGRIETFDSATGRATVKPLIKYPARDRDTGETSVIELPTISNVPVAVMQGGGGRVTFPISEGDPCLLVFSEVSLDEWLTNGGDPDPLDFRRNNLSDAMAIVGLSSFSDWVEPLVGKTSIDYSGTEISIDGSGKVAIGNSSAELLDIVSEALGEIANTKTTIDNEDLTAKAALLALKAKLDGLKGSVG